MSDEKISIIVATYNVENELEKCLKSICGQTYEKIEIIVVDDGSTDRSGEIADRFALTDSRIVVIHKEKNAGLGAACMTGLQAATGELIGFIDSDDYINFEMYDMLYRNLKEYDADMSVCFGKGVSDEKPIDYTKPHASSAEVSTRTNYEVFHGYYNTNHEGNRTNKYFNGDTLSLRNKLFRKHLLEGIVFPDVIVVEDAYVYFDIFKRVKKAVYTTAELYYYYRRSNSLSRTKVYSEEQIEKILDYSVARIVKWRDTLHELQYYDLERQCVNIEIFNLVSTVDFFADNRKKRRLFSKYVKKLVRETKDTKGALSFKDKIRVNIFILSPRLYKKVLEIMYK